MSDARERVRYALNKHGLSLTRGELDSVMRAFDEPKTKAKPAESKPAAKPVAAKPAEKPIAKPATYGKGKHPANHPDKKGS
jgi:hypothetical protein